MSTSEHIYYDDGDVRIGDERAVFGKLTLRTKRIKDISTFTPAGPPEWKRVMRLGVLGLSVMSLVGVVLGVVLGASFGNFIAAMGPWFIVVGFVQAAVFSSPASAARTSTSPTARAFTLVGAGAMNSSRFQGRGSPRYIGRLRWSPMWSQATLRPRSRVSSAMAPSGPFRRPRSWSWKDVAIP